MLSIEGQPHPEQGQLTGPTGPETQTKNQGRQGYQGKNWNKNHNHKQRRPYCVFHGESAGHSTKDCPETKETGKDEEQADCQTSDTAERKRGQHHLHNWPPTVLPNVSSAKRKPNTSLHIGLRLLPKLPTSMAASAFAAASGG